MRSASTIEVASRAIRVLIMACLGWTATVAAQPPKINRPAPFFRATTFAGKPVSLADYRGRVLIINFWATWCAPCKQELPLLDERYRRWHGRGLEVIAITTEDAPPLAKVKPLAAALRIPLARGFRGDYGAIEERPVNYVIDRQGVVRYARAGAFDTATLDAVLMPLLRKPR